MINRIIPLIILLVVGCAPAFTHTTSYVLNTNPQGATIVCDGTDRGYSPIISKRKNIDLIGENRAPTDEETKEAIQNTFAVHSALMFDKNIDLTAEADKGVAHSIEQIKKGLELMKIINGELKIGENKFYTDEAVMKIIKAGHKAGDKETIDIEKWLETVKITRGEVKVGESKIFTDEEILTIIEQVKDIKNNYYIGDCTAYWSSGVSKKYPYSFAPPYKYAGNGIFIYTLQRPEGEGYSQDAEFALKVQQLKQNQQTAEINALIAIRSTEAQERSARAQERQNTKSTTCYTNLGITTCY